jgi:hypothetical protein
MQTANDARLQKMLFRDRVANGRRLAAGDKLFCGVRLFDLVRRRMIAGIRSQHPAWRDAEVEAEFLRQLAIARGLDERGVYTPCGWI